MKPRHAHIAFPGVHCIARSDWHQLITPAMSQGGLNGVSLAILDDANVEQVIDDTIRGYKDLDIQFRWTVGPDSRPIDLGKRLEARGLKAIPVAGMAATDSDLQPASESEVEVEVVGPETLQEYNDLMSKGWAVTAPMLREYNAHVLSTCPSKNPFFIARIDGKGIGSANYFAFPDSAYLMSGVVLPEFRKRGVYRALVQARQEHARKAGISLLTCHAMLHSSAPLLTKLGFRTVCQFKSYVE